MLIANAHTADYHRHAHILSIVRGPLMEDCTVEKEVGIGVHEGRC